MALAALAERDDSEAGLGLEQRLDRRRAALAVGARRTHLNHRDVEVADVLDQLEGRVSVGRLLDLVAPL